MNHWNDWNKQVIEEFRAKGGRAGGRLEGMPLLLLHHTGAKTAKSRVSPLAYQAVGNGYAIFGSKGGSPTHPDWYHNLVAHPQVSLEVGEETIAAQARVTAGEERERIWTKQKEDFPFFAEYEAKTAREIPVIMLEPVS